MVLKYNYNISSSDKKNLKSNLIKLQNHINNPTEKINTYTCIVLHKFQNQHINQQSLHKNLLCLQKGRFHDKIDSTNLGLWTFCVCHHVVWWTGTISIEKCTATMGYQNEGGSRFLQYKLCDVTPYHIKLFIIFAVTDCNHTV